MKAYFAQYKNEDWGTLIHGETRGKAKSRFSRCDPSGEYYHGMWNKIQLTRVPGLDDKPFTYENGKAADWLYLSEDYDENGRMSISELDWFNDCDCEICKGDK
jgi:hypothetical protein